jgi:hypothetical protein
MKTAYLVSARDEHGMRRNQLTTTAKGDAMKFTVNPRNWNYGTSLQGYVTASYAELAAIFGPADPANRDGDGKVSTEWLLKFEDGTDATVYDYKDTSLYDEGLPTPEQFRALPSYDWHIGGRSPEAVHRVTAVIHDYRAFKATTEPADPAPPYVAPVFTPADLDYLHTLVTREADFEDESRHIPDSSTTEPDEAEAVRATVVEKLNAYFNGGR